MVAIYLPDQYSNLVEAAAHAQPVADGTGESLSKKRTAPASAGAVTRTVSVNSQTVGAAMSAPASAASSTGAGTASGQASAAATTSMNIVPVRRAPGQRPAT